jgi:uncharacterized membrane protein YfhO
MISQSWYPGWKARIDGKKVELLRAHYVFMAVAIPAGQHQVEVIYQPDSFVFGVLLSILVGVGLFMGRFEWVRHVFRR